MKQGKLINRIMMLVLLAAVVVYLAASAWRSFRDPYTFVMSYAYTVDDSLEATGFLVREETVLSGGGGTVAKYVANQDIDTIDIGVPVLAMHSPFEVVSKADVYMAYRTFKAFCEDAE